MFLRLEFKDVVVLGYACFYYPLLGELNISSNMSFIKLENFEFERISSCRIIDLLECKLEFGDKLTKYRLSSMFLEGVVFGFLNLVYRYQQS